MTLQSASLNRSPNPRFRTLYAGYSYFLLITYLLLTYTYKYKYYLLLSFLYLPDIFLLLIKLFPIQILISSNHISFSLKSFVVIWLVPPSSVTPYIGSVITSDFYTSFPLIDYHPILIHFRGVLELFQ